MDFTYFVAGLIGAVVGFVAAIIFIALKLNGKRWLLATAFGIALTLAGFFLIDWTRIGSFPPGFLAADLGFIAIYILVGCFVGMSPPLVIRRLWRVIRRPRA